ncbi:MAG: GIY-YIG nuclease family protein [Syntrophomonadaceae bacterium]
MQNQIKVKNQNKVLNQIKSNSGAYLLEVHVRRPFKIRKGRFEGLTLPAGYYYYAGSAQKNLRQRISRHYRNDKVLHWHIDHITAFRGNKITNCWIFEDAPKEMECRVTERLISEFSLASVIKGFGSSDCRNCESHLLAGGQSPLAAISF